MTAHAGWSGSFVGLLAVTVMAFAAGDAHAQDVQRQGDVPYLTGGVGLDEREAMEAKAAEEGMNLKVELTQRGGAFVSDVPIRITGADGSVRLEITTEGPWLFARLPAGEYRVRAELRGAVQEEPVTVPETGRASLIFAFR